MADRSVLSAVCGLVIMTLNPIRRFAMERRNVMVCVIGLVVLVVMGLAPIGFAAPVTPDTAKEVAADKAWDFADGEKRDPRRVS